MSGDYSRINFDPLHDDLGVLLQQGRPLSDAEWNALVLQLRRRIHVGTLDTIGAAVVPMQTPDAFEITINGGDLEIGRGRLYVDGLLAENHGAGTKVWDRHLEEQLGTQAVLYSSSDPSLQQPYYPNPPPLPANGPHLAYLDVWQREVTHLLRAGLIETAVGVDSTTRLQTVWQVKLLPDVSVDMNCSTPLDQIPEFAPSGGRLSTTTTQVPGEPDPCLIPPAGGYKGLENQLYRVEIHTTGGLGAATFKWSRENASVETRVTNMPALDQLVVESIGKDSVLRFSDGDWVEITDDWLELHNLPGELRRIKTANGVDDATRTISLDAPLTASLFPTGPGDLTQPERHTRIKRWDQRGLVRDHDGNVLHDLDLAGSSGEITVPAGSGTGVLLEHGIIATFALDPPGSEFHSGDYWVFAARSINAEIEELELAPPRGIHHHYAKLGFITFPNTFDDCRVFWPPPAVPAGGDHCACTVCVTPQQHASNQPSIQDAIDQVIAAGGGTICLEVGTYELMSPLKIENATSLRIVGKGIATALRSERAVFDAINQSKDIVLEHFAALSLGVGQAAGSALVLRSSSQVYLQHLSISASNQWSAIALAGALAGVVIRDNSISAANGVVSDGAPTDNGTGLMDMRIEKNQFICDRIAIRLPGVSVHQFVSRICGNRVLNCREAGFVLTGATTPGFGIEVSGNVLSVSGDGIIAGIDGLRIADNDVVSSESSANNPRRGIVLVQGLSGDNGIDACHITGNRIAGFQAAGMVMEAALDSVMIKQNHIEDAGDGMILKGPLRNLAVDNNQFTKIQRLAIHIESTAAAATAHVSATGNQLEVLGDPPAVIIVCDRGDCLFSGNYCVQENGSDNGNILLTADSLIVASNRILSERGVSMRLTCKGTQARPHCTVLGNITSGDIVVNAGGNFILPNPWQPLNLSGI